jgi:hypothetical protein
MHQQLIIIETATLWVNALTDWCKEMCRYAGPRKVTCGVRGGQGGITAATGRHAGRQKGKTAAAAAGS